MTDWVLKSASEQRQALRTREISAIDLLEQTIARSSSVSAILNPFALDLYDSARQSAVRADRLLRKGKGGPMCGLPVSVKDSQWLAGVRCANGSLSLMDFVPEQTCMAVERLDQAGAVIFAKTTCPEFCVSGTNNSPLYGATLNPWDMTRTPGGSSGGAAAAIAAGAGALSLGGDGGGSIRIPASFCGVVGFKPSHGLVPRRPGFSTWESLVAYGPICRSVADARMMFGVLADIPRERAAEPASKPLKIIASEDLGFAPVDHDVRVTFQYIVEKIRQTDIKVVSDHPGLPSSVVTWATIATHDMWRHKSRPESGHRVDTDKLGGYTRDFLAFGSQFGDTDIADAQARRNEIYDAYQALFQRHRSNILITPTLGSEAFHHSRVYPEAIGNTDITFPWLDWAGFLYDANLVGMPACTIPMGLGDEGLPLSLQVTGPPGSDLEVLRVAEEIETIIEWTQRIAPGFDGDLTANSEFAFPHAHVA